MSIDEVPLVEFFRVYRDFSLTYIDVCRHFGITKGQMHILRKRHKLPPRPKARCQNRIADPTPAEIAERAAECRAARSAEERARMDRAGKIRWELPTYTFDGRNYSFAGAAP